MGVIGDVGGPITANGRNLMGNTGGGDTSHTPPPLPPAPPSGNFILAENGDALITEAGDNLITET